ncbi:hypothetical protein C8Q80DRAFT_689369 [Daedaleopsis nitida]|nr:hypothetical protein C8Q80DRAFT_689369 [Daedaleopsis nitida]
MDAWRDTHLSIATTFLQKQANAGTGRPSPTEHHSPEAVCQSLEALCAQDLERVHLLQLNIADMREMENMLKRYGCFPPEIICEVFSYLLKPCGPPGQDFCNAVATCRWWRRVATGNANFWTRIRANNPTLARASAERSRNRGLHIVLQDAKCDVDAVVDALAPHSHRIESIHVRHSNALVIADFFCKLNVAAPNLHSLSIHSTRVSVDRLVIPSVFAGHTPSLRCLDLDNVALSTTSAFTSGMVELHLRNTSIPLPAILDILDLCTNLQILTIHGYHLWGDEDQVSADRVVNLPSLREFLLDTQPISDSDLLVSHISLPEPAVLRIEVDSMLDEDFVLPDLADLPCATGIRRLELTWDATTQTASIRGSRSSNSTEQHLVPDVDIAVRGADRLLDAVPQGELPFDASGVEVLVVNSACGAQERGFTKWPDLLRYLPAVKTLRLREPNVPTAVSLLDTLAEGTAAPTGPGGADAFRLAFCPALERLEMRGFAWHTDIERGMIRMVTERWRGAPGVLREVRVGEAQGAPDGTFAFPQGNGNENDSPVQLIVFSAG